MGDGMSEEDIEIAINIYNIADCHEVVLVEAEKIMNELIEEIVDETGVYESHLQFVIELGEGYFDTFMLLLRHAKRLSEAGITDFWFGINDAMRGRGFPIFPIMFETARLFEE